MKNILDYFKEKLIKEGARRNFDMQNYLKQVNDNTYRYCVEFNHSDYCTDTVFQINGDKVDVHYTCDYFCSAYPELCKNGIIDQTKSFKLDAVDEFKEWYNSVAHTIYNPLVN